MAKQILNITISEDDKKILKILSAVTGQSVSTIIALALDEYKQKHAKAIEMAEQAISELKGVAIQ